MTKSLSVQIADKFCVRPIRLVASDTKSGEKITVECSVKQARGLIDALIQGIENAETLRELAVEPDEGWTGDGRSEGPENE